MIFKLYKSTNTILRDNYGHPSEQHHQNHPNGSFSPLNGIAKH